MRAIIAVAACLTLSENALAADLTLRPGPYATAASSWSGFYLGVNAGGGHAIVGHDYSLLNGPAFATVDQALRGAVGGGQVGYNWQVGSAAFGIETDFQFSGLRASIETPCAGGACGAPLTASYTQKLPWFGTLRGRVGYASDGWLLYLTGGYAYTRLEADARATAGALSAALSTQDNRSGWTLGTGVEIALAPRWSAKLEYLYADFGHARTNWVLPAGLPTLVDDAHLSLNLVRAGVNYRF